VSLRCARARPTDCVEQIAHRSSRFPSLHSEESEELYAGRYLATSQRTSAPVPGFVAVGCRSHIESSSRFSRLSVKRLSISCFRRCFPAFRT